MAGPTPLHRENWENCPRNSLSGRTQGIWKYCQNIGNLIFGGQGAGLDFLRNFDLKIENHVNFSGIFCVFRSRNAYLHPILHVITSFPSHEGE